MKFIMDKEAQKLPIFSWCNDMEEGAFQQALDLANHPVTFHHIVTLPGLHRGYGMPIESVIACNQAVIPNAVGSDIGCGMIAIQTDFPAEDIHPEDIKAIMERIRGLVPVGFNSHKYPQEWEGFYDPPDLPIVTDQLNAAKKQLGTLGGGNHFIEMQKGNDGKVWGMLHTGSRNFGYKIAKKYNEIAVKLCARWKSDIPNKELAFLPMETREAKDYLLCMNYALTFAKQNRLLILFALKRAMKTVLCCDFSDPINIHHNYARWEHHFNRNVLVHRKGATSAKYGEVGIIPGSMGTPSYIVEGLGEPNSFTSCSHGAGRAMGRMAASRTLTLEDCNKAMEGIIFGRWGQDRKGRPDYSEAPQAYKNIDTVIGAQLDLARPLVQLHPLGVIKG